MPVCVQKWPRGRPGQLMQLSAGTGLLLSLAPLGVLWLAYYTNYFDLRDIVNQTQPTYFANCFDYDLRRLWVSAENRLDLLPKGYYRLRRQVFQFLGLPVYQKTSTGRRVFPDAVQRPYAPPPATEFTAEQLTVPVALRLVGYFYEGATFEPTQADLQWSPDGEMWMSHYEDISKLWNDARYNAQIVPNTVRDLNNPTRRITGVLDVNRLSNEMHPFFAAVTLMLPIKNIFFRNVNGFQRSSWTQLLLASHHQVQAVKYLALLRDNWDDTQVMSLDEFLSHRPPRFDIFDILNLPRLQPLGTEVSSMSMAITVLLHCNRLCSNILESNCADRIAVSTRELIQKYRNVDRDVLDPKIKFSLGAIELVLKVMNKTSFAVSDYLRLLLKSCERTEWLLAQNARELINMPTIPYRVIRKTIQDPNFDEKNCPDMLTIATIPESVSQINSAPSASIYQPVLTLNSTVFGNRRYAIRAVVTALDSGVPALLLHQDAGFWTLVSKNYQMSVPNSVANSFIESGRTSHYFYEKVQ